MFANHFILHAQVAAVHLQGLNNKQRANASPGAPPNPEAGFCALPAQVVYYSAVFPQVERYFE